VNALTSPAIFSRRIETVWEGLRLVVEEHPDGGVCYFS
jgi:hypothetical protein